MPNAKGKRYVPKDIVILVDQDCPTLLGKPSQIASCRSY
jgi:hypothetical protein